LRECQAVTDETRVRFGKAFQDAVVRMAGRQARVQRQVQQWLLGLSTDPAMLLAKDWVYLGVILDACVGGLAAMAGIPRRVAQLAIFAGLVAAREVFLEEVWKRRCKETVAWERRQDPPITARMKKTQVPPGHHRPTLADLGVVEEEVGVLRAVHQPVDKKRDRWKKEALNVVEGVYGSWTVRLLGGDLAARRPD